MASGDTERCRTNLTRFRDQLAHLSANHPDVGAVHMRRRVSGSQELGEVLECVIARRNRHLERISSLGDGTVFERWLADVYPGQSGGQSKFTALAIALIRFLL